jgi:hypothetical protein
MTAYSLRSKNLQSQLSGLILSLPPYELESVRFSLEGEQLVIEGRIASYEAKCRMESAARAAGFQVQNSLRVTPGIVSFAPPLREIAAASRRTA